LECLIIKLQILIQKEMNFFQLYFFQLLVIKTLDPDPDSLPMLDQDSNESVSATLISSKICRKKLVCLVTELQAQLR
jgi:hypothetical protein